MGIDYGLGKTNVDTETGIRFGVVPTNDLAGWARETLMNDGDDVDFDAHKKQLKSELESAIQRVLKEYGYHRQNDADALAEAIVDDFEWDGYEGTGDCTRYHYEKDGYKLETCSDGDMFVLKSPFYTNAPFCSPCAPGAEYLRDRGEEGDCKAYCMGHDWFENGVAPYPVYDVTTGELVPAKS